MALVETTRLPVRVTPAERVPEKRDRRGHPGEQIEYFVSGRFHDVQEPVDEPEHRVGNEIGNQEMFQSGLRSRP